ncbi:MAG: glucose-1-phosphate adenylyltransferase subunit GlgD [Bilifractor sp.]|jgi:glucose-1-phosphate adenylyltransferase
MARAFGIINSSANYVHVEGLQTYRPIGAFSFGGRYRVIDFPISNMSNSGIDRILVYVRENPRSLTEHIRSAGSYNINSKRGHIQVLFAEANSASDIYNTDVAAINENLSIIERLPFAYVVIAPSYMVYTQSYKDLLDQHIASGADISLLYHHVGNAKEKFLECEYLNLNRQKGVEALERNHGTAKERNIFMDTYVMKRELFIDLIHEATKLSSVYTLSNIVNIKCSELDVRGIPHRGYFESLTSYKAYYDSNMELLDIDRARELFEDNWPIYTVTSDSCPTHYFKGASVKNSMVSNGCLIKGAVENSVIGRGVVIEEGAVVKNSIIQAHSVIGKGIYVDYQIVDKLAEVLHVNELIGTPEHPGYIKREDII